MGSRSTDYRWLQYRICKLRKQIARRNKELGRRLSELAKIRRTAR